jgi:transposase-like protein
MERIGAQIDELFASGAELGEILEEVARLSVRLILQVALEAEVTEWLGRERYSHGDRDREGQRNGHRALRIKSTAGPIELARPKQLGSQHGADVLARGGWRRASR